MNPVSPTRLIGGRYVVLSELGRGAMGAVWRAEDRVTGRHVAVKELHLPEGLGREERLLFRERLLREARSAGRLADPGIVTVYDVVTDGGVDHIVMELVEARTLAEVVASDGPLDERGAVTVAEALLATLRAAHEGGVVHRDVKPGNVMLGPGDRVRLIDFGIAQVIDDLRPETAGSPAHTAPERLAGGPATPASDLWSLGATLFHAVRGHSPFARETTAETISAVLHAELPPVRTRGPLGTVIVGLLRRCPQDRMSGTAAAELLAATPVPGRVSGTSVDVAAYRRRRWRWPAAALVVGLVAGIVGGAALPRPVGRYVPTLAYGDGGDLPVFEITSGTCAQGAPVAGRRFPSSAAVGCDAPHDLEVFQTLDLVGGGPTPAYPGRAQLDAYAAACALVFESDLVGGADKDRLQVVALVPSRASFEEVSSGSHTRDVICLLRAADGSRLTGTRIAGPA